MEIYQSLLDLQHLRQPFIKLHSGNPSSNISSCCLLVSTVRYFQHNKSFFSNWNILMRYVILLGLWAEKHLLIIYMNDVRVLVLFISVFWQQKKKIVLPNICLLSLICIMIIGNKSAIWSWVTHDNYFLFNRSRSQKMILSSLPRGWDRSNRKFLTFFFSQKICKE